MTHGERALAHFAEGYSCAQSVLLAFSDQSGLEPGCAARLMSGFGGGVGKTGGLCGALSALVALIGLVHGREMAGEMDRQAETYRRVRAALEEFREQFGSTQCRELLGGDILFPDAKERARDTVCPRYLAASCRLADRYAAREEAVRQQPGKEGISDDSAGTGSLDLQDHEPNPAL